MWVGLTGRNGSGKGVVADILKKKGFDYYSLSDVIRIEIKKEGQAVTREALIAMGRRLRVDGGPGILAEIITGLLDKNRNFIIDSVRHPDEIKILKEQGPFHLIKVDADQKIRFERCKKRNREGDPTTLDEFVRLENEELTNKTQNAQQLLATEALADFVLVNETSLDDAEAQLKDILNQIRD